MNCVDMNLIGNLCFEVEFAGDELSTYLGYNTFEILAELAYNLGVREVEATVFPGCGTSLIIHKEYELKGHILNKRDQFPLLLALITSKVST